MSDKHSSLDPATHEGSIDSLVGQLIDGRYRILNLLAVGGMGRVYRAEQVSLSRIVALKVLAIPREMATVDPHFRERFALEAATASRLANPNTVTIFDYGRTPDDLYYLVMEYVEGITLGRLLKTEKRLVPERALHIARQVCHSLVEAHARGIIHRDIKPANILLLEPDLAWVKVLDFGIARFTDESTQDPEAQMTRAGTYVGTPEYMAPESFYARVDPRGDVYSIGVLLYLMLSGRVPLQGPTNTATILMAVHDPVPHFDPALGIAPSIEGLILRCLAKKPEDRPQTMAEVLNEINAELVAIGGMLSSPLHPALTGTGVRPNLELTMRPGSHPEVALHPQRRSGLLVAVVLLLLAAGVGLGFWLRPAPAPLPELKALEPVAVPKPVPVLTPLPVPAARPEAPTPSSATTPSSAAGAVGGVSTSAGPADAGGIPSLPPAGSAPPKTALPAQSEKAIPQKTGSSKVSPTDRSARGTPTSGSGRSSAVEKPVAAEKPASPPVEAPEKPREPQTKPGSGDGGGGYKDSPY